MSIRRVTVSGELYGVEKWANVYHVDAGDAVDPQDVFDAFVTFLTGGGAGDGVLLNCPGTVATGTVGVHASAISWQSVVDPAPPIVRALNLNGGQNTGGGLPVDTCLVISWQTGKAGRSFRGRTYLPPWHSNKNTDGVGRMPSAIDASVTQLALSCGQLLTDLSGFLAPLVVYSRHLGTAQQITGGYIDNEWDTQRRRSKSQVKTKFPF